MQFFQFLAVPGAFVVSLWGFGIAVVFRVDGVRVVWVEEDGSTASAWRLTGTMCKLHGPRSMLHVFLPGVW